MRTKLGQDLPKKSGFAYVVPIEGRRTESLPESFDACENSSHAILSRLATKLSHHVRDVDYWLPYVVSEPNLVEKDFYKLRIVRY